MLEYLNQVAGKLPAAAKPALGPDATGVGWIYEYALVDRTGGHDLAVALVSAAVSNSAPLDSSSIPDVIETSHFLSAEAADDVPPDSTNFSLEGANRGLVCGTSK